MGPEQLLKIVVSKNISLVNISRGAYKNCERRKEGDQSDLKMPQNYDPVIIRGCKFVMSSLGMNMKNWSKIWMPIKCKLQFDKSNF